MRRTLFGTDGIRGVANRYPITPEMMVRLGRAVVHGLRGEGGNRPRILIGRDTRLSGTMLESAIGAGICAAGGDVFLAGVMPTPGVAYLTATSGYEAGIVISASHNPFEDNGIKIFNHQGYKLPDAVEKAIEDQVLDENFQDNRGNGRDIGVISPAENAAADYLAFLATALPAGASLAGLKVVLDCANGAAFDIAPRIFKALGADVETLFASPDGCNINQGCGSQHTETLKARVVEQKAHVGLAFDGDADRLIAVDEKGQNITGDQMLAVLARHLKEKGLLTNNTVVSTVMSNVGLHQALGEMDIRLVTADVGDRYVLERMQRHQAVIGGEDSGHMIFLDRHTSGDGVFTALRLIGVMRDTGLPLSELRSVMRVYPQVLLNVKVRERVDLNAVPEIKNAILAAEKQLKGQGRVLVRYSGTQPLCRVMAEGPDKAETHRICKEIAEVIQEKLGV